MFFLILRRFNRRPNFIPWAFLDLLVLFLAVSLVDAKVAVTGIGTVMAVFSLLVLANKEIIWKNYRSGYQDSGRGWRDRLLRPTQQAYRLNIYFLWPAVLLSGLALLASAIWFV